MLRRATLAFCAFSAPLSPLAWGQTDGPRPTIGVVAAQLTSYVRPAFPATAKGGTFHVVTLGARLGADGRLHDLKPFGEGDEFLQAAIDAASQWVYVPYSLNGKAIDMDAVVSVDFSSQEHRTGLDKPLRISDPMMARLADKQPQPSYPQTDAKGAVVLLATIGKDGRVGNLQLVSGPAPLRSASLEAARQWTYKPYLFDGVPVEIQTSIMFNFAR